MMQLQVLLPTEVLVDCHARSITAEAENGSFCLRPRHVDFVTALAPGILTYLDEDELEHWIGLADGVLVKTGRQVLVSVQHAVAGEHPGQLRELVRNRFEVMDEHERQAVSAVARLEADFVRRFLALEERPHV